MSSRDGADSVLTRLRGNLPRRPYATDDFRFGLKPTGLARAMQRKYLQVNHPSLSRYIVLDVDKPYAGASWIDAELPAPTIIARNAWDDQHAGRAHLFYELAEPVPVDEARPALDEKARANGVEDADRLEHAEAVRQELLTFVATGGEVTQVDETREHWLDQYRHWYKAVLPLPSFRRGVFVELRLVDEDEEVPIVHLVNAHPQT